MTLPVTPADLGNLKAAGHQYRDYCRIRIEFLLRRRQTFPDFPGVQTGYNSITGREFDSKDILSYSWINGRGACVFSRFSRYYPDLAKDLRAYASAVIEVMEKHWEMNDHTFPFLLDLDGMEKVVGQKKPRGYKSYSDLYAAAGFLDTAPPPPTTREPRPPGRYSRRRCRPSARTISSRSPRRHRRTGCWRIPGR